MAWVRIDDGAMTHPKVVALSDKAFRLWVWGLCYCQKHLTDGFVPPGVLAFSGHSQKIAAALISANLWHARDGGGWDVHDYLDWNDSRIYVESIRQLAKARMVLVRDPEMRQQLRDRDQDRCRYCAVEVNWADRKSRTGATYDHITPGAGDTLENLVIACRGCNSQKQKRTPEQASMRLLPPPQRDADVSRSVSKFISHKNPLIGSGVVRSTPGSEKENQDGDVGERAGALLNDLYPAWYCKYRNGAKLRLIANTLAYQDALALVQTWDDARLAHLAQVFLTTDDDWISQTDRGFRVFAAKASWCDDRLKQAEVQARA